MFQINQCEFILKHIFTIYNFIHREIKIFACNQTMNFFLQKIFKIVDFSYFLIHIDFFFFNTYIKTTTFKIAYICKLFWSKIFTNIPKYLRNISFKSTQYD